MPFLQRYRSTRTNRSYRLIAFSEKSIRKGALSPSLPNGYIMDSQVIIEVLNLVYEAESFKMDIPWNELTNE